jgi:Tfp pilus assembly protein FimT
LVMAALMAVMAVPAFAGTSSGTSCSNGTGASLLGPVVSNGQCAASASGH